MDENYQIFTMGKIIFSIKSLSITFSFLDVILEKQIDILMQKATIVKKQLEKDPHLLIRFELKNNSQHQPPNKNLIWISIEKRKG